MISKYRHLSALALLGASQFALAAPDLGQSAKQATNWTAIAMFAGFVVLTLFITKWAAAKTRSASDFYTAGGGITGFQNGLAIAGDFMSAASFLGISAAVFANGFDGLIYAIGFLVGWPVLTFLMAERLRNLGRFTFADVAAYRFAQKPVRMFAAAGTLVTVLFYLIAQMVGAGQLIKLLFGLDYWIAVVLVGVLMMVYVLFGGMTATTWVQIIKAVMLLAGTTFMAFSVLSMFNFSPEALFAKAVEVHAKGDSIMGPGGFIKDPISGISFGMALMFGTAGLPHILMGFGAIVLVGTNPNFKDAAGKLLGGDNMAAVHLANAVGGDVFLGFISAVAFATILAVVAGLTLSGASAVSHDLYATVIKKGKPEPGSELRVSKLTTIALGAIAVLLGIVFEKQNVAFMVSLAFAIAASANFPVLFMSVLWSKCTTRGATVGGFLGLATAVGLTVLSKSVWVDVFHNSAAIFPYTSPALFSMFVGFAGVWLFSITDKSPRAAIDKAGFEAQEVRSETGIGASAASAH